MSERKVLNKYFPPDFDPSKIPRRKQPKDAQQVVRLMAPFSMRCNTCGEYTYKGKKFNARKETVQGEDYFGIKIFRFYIKCPRCSAEITFKTDPKNTDYAAEHGASRNFEPWRDAAAVEASDLSSSIDPLAHLLAAEAEEAEQEDLDPMKSLEARTLDSRREMEILDALQDIRTRNARNERIDESEILEELKKERERKEKLLKEQDPEEIERKRLEEEDEKLVRKYFNKIQDIELEEELEGEEDQDQGIAESSKNGSSSSSNSTSNIIKRARPMEDQEQDEVEGSSSKKSNLEKEPDLKSLLSESARAQLLTKSSTSMAPPPSKKKKGKSAFGIVKKKS